jgi:hypothetical protein
MSLPRWALLAALLAAGAAARSAPVPNAAAPGAAPPAGAPTLADLGERFWRWRAAAQPMGTDDIPRIERPADFSVDWSESTRGRRGLELERFERQWRDLEPDLAAAAAVDAAARVDHRLLGSALARVRWETSIEQRWRRDPGFYVEETLGSLFEVLVLPTPWTTERQRQIVARMQRIPITVEQARENLTDLRQPFARLALASLDGIGDRIRRTDGALAASFTSANRVALATASDRAIAALEGYRAWLATRLPGARPDVALGRDAYLYFLRNVALMPYTPEQLLAMSRQEWSRAVAFEAGQQQRNAGLGRPARFADAAEEIAAATRAELAIRAFLSEQGLLTVPPGMPHYRLELLPAHLEPLRDFGETDDLGGASRIDQDAVRYIDPPRPGLGFFGASMASDPRAVMVHEGLPGHFFQLSLGRRNPDPLRRHYYDSGANEGIGFYAEEMMLQAGLFDDDGATRATVYTFMRLRALRVEVDVKLALGEFSLTQAADYLARSVPMDPADAQVEAARFASTPGQGISYQIGKLQVIELLADARRRQGAGFSLRAFHDFVWNNGNVPLSLQRLELLQDASALPSPVPSPPERR